LLLAQQFNNSKFNNSKKTMNQLRKYMGIVWIAIGLAAAWFGIFELGLKKIGTGKQEDLVFGIIMLGVLTPIIVGGLLIFGKYALSDEYEQR
jgi:hypothetical protein